MPVSDFGKAAYDSLGIWMSVRDSRRTSRPSWSAWVSVATLGSGGRFCPAGGLRLLFLSGVGQGLVYDADGDADADGDGADGFPALAAGEDGGALVVVDDGAPAADAVQAWSTP